MLWVIRRLGEKLVVKSAPFNDTSRICGIDKHVDGGLAGATAIINSLKDCGPPGLRVRDCALM
jgi:hypothetical protein